MGYTYEQVILKCQEAFSKIETFYQAKVVNYRGKTSDTDEYYSEVVAKFVVNHLEEFKTKIPVIERKKPYRSEKRKGDFQEDSNRVEEITAMKMFNHSEGGHKYDFIGKIVDYQTPLKSKRGDTAGKIDLLSYDGQTLRILELKKPDSVETMLRCVLEGYTYMKTVKGEKLIEEWELPKDTIIKASPFVFRNGVQHQEMLEDRKYLKQLMRELNSVPYYITEDNEKYYVTED